MSVRLSFIQAGYCRHPEAMMVAGGSWKPISIPSSVAVIEHPTQGVILFDTGYTMRFYEETKNFPNKFYAMVTPAHIRPEDSALEQLKKLGVSERDVKHVILSHFHADHVAGVSDFPHADYIYMKSGYDAVKDLGALAAVKAGVLKGLLPKDFLKRSKAIEAEQFTEGVTGLVEFSRGFDIFGDQSIIAIPLPGHAPGHMGILVNAQERFFLVADACWLGDTIKLKKMPHPMARILFSSKEKYVDTVERLHDLSVREKNLNIVPCHCTQTLEKMPKMEARV
jgi:glyoxylase-like metal-dependent hydrolase (beta-lactamase superfamily II)